MIEVIDTISWREPLWLLLALQPLALYLVTLLVRSMRREYYADPHLLAWSKIPGGNRSRKNQLQSLLLLLAWLGFAICMAGPRTADKVFTTDPSAFTNIMVVFDVSRSMDAHDVSPSRLARARLELYDFLERTQNSRIGIVLYAARPHLLSPLTTDKNLLQHYISTIDSSLLPTRGSDLEEALEYTARYLGTNNQQAILLISDGESTTSDILRYEKLLSSIKEQNITIYSLVIGTEEGAPLLSEKTGWLTFENQDVISAAKPGLLKDIALLTNGKYSTLHSDDQEWRDIYDNGIAKLNPANLVSKKSSDLVTWNEWYPWFLAFAAFCFIVANLNLPINKYRLFFSLAIGIAFIASGFIATDSFADENYQHAYQLYSNKKFTEAEKHFSAIDSFPGRIGQASAAYREKNYSKAVVLFIQATLKAQTDEQRVHALFNLANSYYQLENYPAAANVYRDILRYQPGFPAAQTNLAYAEDLIREKENEQSSVTTTRNSRGPRTAKPAADMDLAGGKLSMESEDDSKPYSLSGEQDSLSQQLPSDLSSAGLVTQDIEIDDDTQWTYQLRSINDMTAMMSSASSDEHEFWRRLFEWEEGFPAPLEEPKDLPGVKPW